MFGLLSIGALFLHSILRLESGNCLNEALFHRRVGKYLPGRVIRTENTDSEFECSLYCSREERCASVNYKHTGDRQGLCELNDEWLRDFPEKGLDLDKPEFSYLGIVKRNCKDTKQIFSPKTKRCISLRTCQEMLNNDESLENGVYQLQLNDSSQKYPVYCHMTNIPGCRGGGWTLVIKTDGSKKTFINDSPYWSNKITYQVQEGLEGLITEKESKLASYWNTPFTKICLGMKVNGVSKWIKLDYEASSLYSVIAGGTFRETTVGRGTWKSLISGSSLQRNCNLEGFNIAMFLRAGQYINARLGIIANNERYDCATCDSWMGFGVSSYVCGVVSAITSGNFAKCAATDNGNKITPAFGFILVQ